MTLVMEYYLTQINIYSLRVFASVFELIFRFFSRVKCGTILLPGPDKMSLVELYMKELLMQQKLQHEYELQQGQNHANAVPPPVFGTFGTLPASSSPPPFLSPPAALSVFSSFAPGTAGPFASAPHCPARPLTSFPTCPQGLDPLVPPPLLPSHNPFLPFGDNTFMPAAPTFAQMAAQLFNSGPGTFSYPSPFSDFAQSPSSLASAGSCASLDSFPSPAGSGSPDSTSCSSLNGPLPSSAAAAPPPKKLPQQKFPTFNGITKPQVPVDFSHLDRKPDLSAKMVSSLEVHQKKNVLNGQNKSKRTAETTGGNNSPIPRKIPRRTTVFVPIGSVGKLCPGAMKMAANSNCARSNGTSTEKLGDDPKVQNGGAALTATQKTNDQIDFTENCTGEPDKMEMAPAEGRHRKAGEKEVKKEAEKSNEEKVMEEENKLMREDEGKEGRANEDKMENEVGEKKPEPEMKEEKGEEDEEKGRETKKNPREKLGKKVLQSPARKRSPVKRQKSGGPKEEEQEEEVEEEGEAEVPKTMACRWMRCKKMFEDDNKLYDHMATDHVEMVGKWAMEKEQEQQQQQKKGELRRKRSNDANGGKEAAEPFRCRWHKCEMHARRGDAQKKLDWLLNHLVIRHAPRAHPHKCLFSDCSLRFKKLQALKDHLRSAHDDINAPRGNGRKNGAETSKMCWFEFRPRVHISIVRDCIDARTIAWIRHRLDPSAGIFDVFDDALSPTESLARPKSEGNKDQQNEDNKSDGLVGKIPRMPVEETIAHLKSIFPMQKRRSRAVISLAA